MVWYLGFWFLCVLMQLGLLAILFYELLALTDLEADEVNPFDATALINNWVLPEFALQGLLSLLFLFTGHWLMFLLAFPLTCYHAMLLTKRQHLIDVTEVFRSLNFEKNFRVIKVAFYMIFLAVIVIRLVFTAFIIIRNVDDDVHIF